MPRVVPSQVLKVIDALPTYDSAPNWVNLKKVGSANLAGVLNLLEQVPDELLTMNSETYASMVLAKSEIRELLQGWQADRMANVPSRNTPYQIANDPIRKIRDALSVCPDESPTPTTSELKFVTDTALRANLRNDIGVVARALADGEWKAATVLAGATIEAVLLWELQNRSAAKVQPALSKLSASDVRFKNLSTNLERWDLHDYIEVSAEIGVIKPDTVTEARLAKGFRNLIHPGRAQRLGQTCDRGTAHFVIRCPGSRGQRPVLAYGEHGISRTSGVCTRSRQRLLFASMTAQPGW